LSKIPSSEDIGKTGYMELKRFEKRNFEGLKAVLIEDIFSDNMGDYEPFSPDFTWFYSKLSNKKSSGWNGFMEKFYSDSIYHASKIIPLPFIKNPPSDYQFKNNHHYQKDQD